MPSCPGPFLLPLFTRARGETVWKSGMGPKSGFRKRPSEVVAAKKGGRNALVYFPNGFLGRFSEVRA